MPDYCTACDHELTMGRCWRLSCPLKGARESVERTRPGPFHRNAKPEQEGLL